MMAWGEAVPSTPMELVSRPSRTSAQRADIRQYDNVRAAELPPLTEAQMQAVRDIYDQYLRETIHPQW